MCGLWDRLLAAPESDWIELITERPDHSEDWRALARRGGFPTPALELHSDEDRTIWFDGYVRTYLERDLQALSSISALPDFRRLMRAACVWGSSSIRLTLAAMYRYHSLLFIAISTCLRHPICWCACPLTLSIAPST